MYQDPTDQNPMWNRVQGHWRQLAGNVRQQWGKLTDDDIQQVNGQREVLAGKIQDRYGVTQQEADRQIDEWADRIKF